MRPKPFQFSGLSHTAFATSNLDMTVEYWRDLLGFKMVIGMQSEQGRQYAFQISQQMMVFFFEWENVEPIQAKRHGEPVEGPFIFDHLAIEVSNFESLSSLQNQFISAGFPVSDIIDHGFLNSIYTFDPNGIPLEFTYMRPEFNVFTKPLLVDKNPSDVVKAGFDPQEGKWPPPEKEDEYDFEVIIEGNEKKYFED